MASETTRREWAPASPRKQARPSPRERALTSRREAERRAARSEPERGAWPPERAASLPERARRPARPLAEAGSRQGQQRPAAPPPEPASERPGASAAPPRGRRPARPPPRREPLPGRAAWAWVGLRSWGASSAGRASWAPRVRPPALPRPGREAPTAPRAGSLSPTSRSGTGRRSSAGSSPPMEWIPSPPEAAEHPPPRRPRELVEPREAERRPGPPEPVAPRVGGRAPAGECSPRSARGRGT